MKSNDGRSERIIESVAYSWQSVAIALGFSGPQIKSIEADYPRRSQDASREIFIRWLDGDCALRGPLTWTTLIDCLEEAMMKDLAENIKRCLCNCH